MQSWLQLQLFHDQLLKHPPSKCLDVVLAAVLLNPCAAASFPALDCC
jgi:hypothetical protein